MLNIVRIIFILYSLFIIRNYTSKQSYQISYKRKLEETQTFSEITVTSKENHSFINENFTPQPYVEYGENNSIIMKWNKTISDCSYMFYNSSIESIDLSNFQTSEVTSMEYMFMNCNKLTDFNIKNKKFSKLKTIKGIFNECNLLNNISFENIDFNELIY